MRYDPFYDPSHEQAGVSVRETEQTPPSSGTGIRELIDTEPPCQGGRRGFESLLPLENKAANRIAPESVGSNTTPHTTLRIEPIGKRRGSPYARPVSGLGDRFGGGLRGDARARANRAAGLVVPLANLLRGYIVRGGDGKGTALFGYAWTSGPLRLVRAANGGIGTLIVKRFQPTKDGRRRAHLMAMAVDGTVKRVVKRRKVGGVVSAVVLTTEQAEALRRSSSKPDVDGGTWDEVRMRRVYEPLVQDGLLEKSVKPWVSNDAFDLVHYETTEIGKWALAVYDRNAKQASKNESEKTT